MSETNCKGCLAFYERGGGRCDWMIANETNEGDCPCTHCIVKMMCQDACDAFKHQSSDCIILSDNLHNSVEEFLKKIREG